MPPIIRDLFLSKKFLVALFTIGGSLAAYFGWNVDTTKILAVASPFLLYIGAQGWADAGKEKAKVDQATVLSAQRHAVTMQQMAQDHETAMRTKFPCSLMAASSETHGKEAGFTRIGVMLGAVVIGLVIALACGANPGQAVLRTGQCVLDNGVLSKVLVALGQSDYIKAVEALALQEAPTLVDCALQAVASQQAPAPGPGSGSAELPKGAMPASSLAQRAREVIAARRARGN